MRVVGVDPGLDGAIAVVYDNGTRFRAYALPKGRWKGRGHVPLWDQMPDHIEALCFEADYAFIEKVQTRPKEGRSSAFKFGQCAGGIHAAVAMCRVPVRLVSPSVWKMSMSIGHDKNLALKKAHDLFPQDHDQMEPIWGERNKAQITGIAEAALIGYYGYRILSKGDGHETDS